MDIKKITKEAGDSSLRTLETVGGFMGANAVSKMAKINTLMGTIAILIAGIGIAVFSGSAGKGYVFEKMLPSAGVGMAAFGAIKTLNLLSGDVVSTGIPVQGLDGFSLPEPVRNFFKEWTPQLNGVASLAGTYNGQPIEMVVQPDGSYAMRGLGALIEPIYTPELSGMMPEQLSAGAGMLDVQL